MKITEEQANVLRELISEMKEHLEHLPFVETPHRIKLRKVTEKAESVLNQVLLSQ